MAKVLATKPDSLSSSLRTHVVEGKNRLTHFDLHMHTMTHMDTHMHTKQMNKCSK